MVFKILGGLFSNKKKKKKPAKPAGGRAKSRPKKSQKKPVKKRRPGKPAEKEIGKITHYFGKISVGIVKLKSTLKTGDKIHIKGAHIDLKQAVKSMQINHKNVTSASKGAEAGIKLRKKVHPNDTVYRVLSK